MIAFVSAQHSELPAPQTWSPSKPIVPASSTRSLVAATAARAASCGRLATSVGLLSPANARWLATRRPRQQAEDPTESSLTAAVHHVRSIAVVSQIRRTNGQRGHAVSRLDLSDRGRAKSWQQHPTRGSFGHRAAGGRRLPPHEQDLGPRPAPAPPARTGRGGRIEQPLPVSLFVHSTSPAPAARRARVAGGAEERAVSWSSPSSKRRRQAGCGSSEGTGTAGTEAGKFPVITGLSGRRR